MSEYRHVVAVGASAGGVEALRALVAGLPADYPGAILVVLHLARDAPSALPAILNRSGPMRAAAAVDGEPIRRGRIYVAPSDLHLLLLAGHLKLTKWPSENGHRPAIDPLFRSVAHACHRRAVGVVLSGTRDDGASGLAAIVAHGGSAVVQDPSDALHPAMPGAALAQVPTAQVAPAARIGALLAGITAVDPSAEHLSPARLVEERGLAVESALWMAMRALREKSALSRRMADVPGLAFERYRALAADADNASETIRQLIAQLGTITTHAPDHVGTAGTPPDLR
jgi:two-component system chemotaxis response regulator CheB